ncbi:MAG: substrate-binding domain-containing protein, partial [Sulfolobales archaeon]
MVNPKVRKATIIAVVLVLAIVVLRLTGVLTLEPVVDVKTTTSPTLRGLTLNGAGATFPYPQIVEWVRGFYNRSGISINYQPVGSGAGLSQFLQNVTDFACSDPPLKRGDWEKYRGTVMQI